MLRRRLIASVTLVTAVSLSGSFATVAALFDYSQRTSFDAALLHVAHTESREASQYNFRFSARPGPADSDVGPLRDFGVIYGENGDVLAATAPFEQRAPRLRDLPQAHEQPFDFWFEDAHLRGVLVPIPSAPDKLVLIASSRAKLDATSSFLHRAMFVAFLVAAAWASALVVWLIRRWTLHHENIATVARRVAKGDLDARVTTHASDIDEAQLGRDIDQMIDRLSALVTAQVRFTANAAHELRSPIAAVYGELQQTLRKPRDSAGYRAGIERALVGAERLKQLVDDLLTLARPTQGEPDTAVDVDLVLKAALLPLEDWARERDVRIEVRPEREASKVVGRARDLERMFRNLVENAVNHSEPGGRVALSSTLARPDQVEIRVVDDGPGVPGDERERIFEPFYRGGAGRAGAQHGSGLGLAIAREVARAHHGDIEVDAARDGSCGACFVVRLPRAADGHDAR
jgi:two-component system heavy metal sensor histidine kinase CusS